MRAPLVALVLLCAVNGNAQPASPLDFPRGPAQWLMTGAERNAWKGVRTLEEAQKLVELFWVRRDPTPGTFINEFRDEFRSRSEFADRRFKEGNRRGSLTERGGVLMLLGFPEELGEEVSKRSSQSSSGGSTDPTGGRALAGRDIWNYSREQAARFGVPKIEVVFIHDGASGRVRRDTQRNDFLSAIPAATKYYIRNPELTEMPEWASRELRRVPMQAGAEVVEVDRPSESAGPGEGPNVEDRGSKAGVQGRTSKVEPTAGPASVGKLTLVGDAFAIEPESGSDPFDALVPLSEFRRDGELGWVAEYCTGSLGRALSNVEVTLRITGLIKGERVNFNAPAEELVPDSIKASPGCYLVRGGVPLMEMDPASYTLFVKIGSYNLTKDFRVIE